MLDVLAVFGDQGRWELEELDPELGDELGADEVLDWLLGIGVGVDVDVELSSSSCSTVGSFSVVGGGSLPGAATYHELGCLGVMSDLGYGDGAGHISLVGG